MALEEQFPCQQAATAMRHVRGFRSRTRRRVAFMFCRGKVVQNEDGGSLIEFAITLSALMAFVMALMELCIAFYSYGMISECAREATRWAIVRGSTCQTSSSTSCTATTTSVSAYATGRNYPNPGGGTMTATTTYPDGDANPGSRVAVDIRYTLTIRLPLIPKNSLALETASSMYILQ
jgi:Flp pilus assembly protein TadG